MKSIVYHGESDLGYEREYQEDYIGAREFDDHNMLVSVADGAGSHGKSTQPAMIVVNTLNEMVENAYKSNADLFKQDPKYFLKNCLLMTNRVLGAFAMANEEVYAGYAASVTTAYISEEENLLEFAHCGNTRLYLIRINKEGIPKLTLISKDHTAAQELLDAGEITFDEYHVHPDRLLVTSGLGVFRNPQIQVYRLKLKPNDIILMTSDGIHSAINSQGLLDITISSLLQNEDDPCGAASKALVAAAKNLKYADNMSAFVLYKL